VIFRVLVKSQRYEKFYYLSEYVTTMPV